MVQINFISTVYFPKNIIIFIFLMSIRRGWTQEEDKVLKLLKQEGKVKKWSSIAKLMDFEFNMCGRNGKQCRQRYNNHLEEGIVENKLSLEQEKQLEQLNHQIGNKWSVIAKAFKGRTANYLKNQLYSKLRKSIRKLNKFIKETKIKDVKPFKLNIVYKIVQSNDFKIFEKQRHSEDDLTFYAQLKEKLFRYAEQPLVLGSDDKMMENDTVNQSKRLMEELIRFTRKYEQLNRRMKKPRKRYFCEDDIILNSLSNNKISPCNQSENLQHPSNIQSSEAESKMDEQDSDESSSTSLRKQPQQKMKKYKESQVEVTKMQKNDQKFSDNPGEKYPQVVQKNPNQGVKITPKPNKSTQSSLIYMNQSDAIIEQAELLDNSNCLNQMLQESQQCQFIDIQYLDHFKSYYFMDESLFQ